MKKIFITLVILIGATIALQSCKKSSENIAAERNEIIKIDKDNTPDLSFFSYKTSALELDENRDSYLDIGNNTLYIPIKINKNKLTKKTIEVKSVNSKTKYVEPDYTFYIAKRYTPNLAEKYPRCQGRCKCGIGFRCGGFTEYPKHFSKTFDRRDREQPISLAINEKYNRLEIKFLNDVDWEYLKCN